MSIIKIQVGMNLQLSRDHREQGEMIHTKLVVWNSAERVLHHAVVIAIASHVGVNGSHLLRTIVLAGHAVNVLARNRL